MEAEGCGSIVKKTNKKPHKNPKIPKLDCKQIKDFLRCEGEEEGD